MEVVKTTIKAKPDESYQKTLNTCKIWYALWTAARTEKRLHSRLTEAGIESYLPIQKSLRQWKDRKKIVDIPLFSSYIFVHITAEEYYKVLNMPGAVRFICFEGKAVSIPEKQILAIRNLIVNGVCLETISGNLKKGTTVKIKYGPLQGLEAELCEYLNQEIVILRFNEIRQNMIVHISTNMLERVN